MSRPHRLLFFLALIAITSASCLGNKRIKELEDELENTTLITYQLLDENTRLKKQIKGLAASGGGGKVITKVVEDEAPLEESKRRLFTMRMAIMNFQLTEEKFPETVQELKEVLGNIPNESRSKSNVIHLERNGRGGWIYDPDEGTLEINSYAR